MNCILLMMFSEPNLRLMQNALGARHNVVAFDEARYRGSLRPYDLIIVDGVMHDRYVDAIVAVKEAALPTFLPVLLVTARENVGLATRSLWKSVDEVILTPIERVELQARVEVMLRARQLSAELYQRNQDMEAFVHAVAHELRAPLRAMTGFAQAVIEDAQLPADSLETGYLQRIVDAAAEMKNVLDALLVFARLGMEVDIQTVWLEPLLEECLDDLNEEIATTGAHVHRDVRRESVEADLQLLKMVLRNLISNALKFRCKERPLSIFIRAFVRGGYCRIVVEDNGIGMLPEDTERVFNPFTRLHGSEEFPGVGLGLSIVRKAVTAMKGRCGAISHLGEGSMFWVELPQAEVEEHEGATRR